MEATTTVANPCMECDEEVDDTTIVKIQSWSAETGFYFKEGVLCEEHQDMKIGSMEYTIELKLHRTVTADSEEEAREIAQENLDMGKWDDENFWLNEADITGVTEVGPTANNPGAYDGF